MSGEVKQKLLRLRRFQPAALVLLLGFVLLILPGGEAGTETLVTEQEKFDRIALQAEMEQVLQRIEGVGKLRLMLMVDSGVERELAKNCTGSLSEKEREESRETVIIGAGGGEQEVVVTRSVYPRFTGALVVCEGADNANVRYAVMTAVSVLTNLGSNRISIVKGSS